MTISCMPERSEGIPFFFLVLDMGVARFQFSVVKYSWIVADKNQTWLSQYWLGTAGTYIKNFELSHQGEEFIL